MRAKALLAGAVAAIFVGGIYVGRLLGMSRIQRGIRYDNEFAESDADGDDDDALHMPQQEETTAAALEQQQRKHHVPDEEAEAAALRVGRYSVGGDHADDDLPEGWVIARYDDNSSGGVLTTKRLDGGAAGTRDSSSKSSNSRSSSSNVRTTDGGKESLAPTSEGSMPNNLESLQREEEVGGKAQVQPLAVPHTGVLESVMSTYKEISEEILVRSRRFFFPSHPTIYYVSSSSPFFSLPCSLTRRIRQDVVVTQIRGLIARLLSPLPTMCVLRGLVPCNTNICKSDIYIPQQVPGATTTVVFTLNRSFYPTTSAVPPVSFLIFHPGGEIQIMWSQTVRRRKTKRR